MLSHTHCCCKRHWRKGLAKGGGAGERRRSGSGATAATAAATGQPCTTRLCRTCEWKAGRVGRDVLQAARPWRCQLTVAAGRGDFCPHAQSSCKPARSLPVQGAGAKPCRDHLQVDMRCVVYVQPVVAEGVRTEGAPAWRHPREPWRVATAGVYEVSGAVSAVEGRWRQRRRWNIWKKQRRQIQKSLVWNDHKRGGVSVSPSCISAQPAAPVTT